MLDTSGLPDFDNFAYQIARKRAGSCILSWKKLRECERRLALCRWLGIDGEIEATGSRHRLFDSIAAFLYSFETSLQFLKDKFKRRGGAPHFDRWLDQLPEHDVLVRALRSLRHLEAHIDTVPTCRHIALVVSPPDVTGDSEVRIDSQRWKLHSLTVEDLRRLDSPRKLNVAELPEWERQGVGPTPSEAMSRGLERIARIMDAAEGGICGLPKRA
jgi:hypothetical protein